MQPRVMARVQGSDLCRTHLDVLALIPLLDVDLAEAFRVFDPRLMYVSRDSNGLNRTMRLDKDHALGITVLTED